MGGSEAFIQPLVILKGQNQDQLFQSFQNSAYTPAVELKYSAKIKIPKGCS